MNKILHKHCNPDVKKISGERYYVKTVAKLQSESLLLTGIHNKYDSILLVVIDNKQQRKFNNINLTTT